MLFDGWPHYWANPFAEAIVNASYYLDMQALYLISQLADCQPFSSKMVHHYTGSWLWEMSWKKLFQYVGLAEVAQLSGFQGLLTLHPWTYFVRLCRRQNVLNSCDLKIRILTSLPLLTGSCCVRYGQSWNTNQMLYVPSMSTFSLRFKVDFSSDYFDQRREDFINNFTFQWNMLKLQILRL